MSKRRERLHPLTMAAVASLNDEREEVDRAAAVSDIECGGFWFWYRRSHLDVLILAPDGRRVAGIDVRQALDAHHLILLSGICGLGLTLALVWMPLKGLLLLPPKRMVVNESATATRNWRI